MFKNSNNIQKIIMTTWLVTSFVLFIWWTESSPPDFSGWLLVFVWIAILLSILVFLGIPTFIIYKLWADKK